jgi:hypothetical protein
VRRISLEAEQLLASQGLSSVKWAVCCEKSTEDLNPTKLRSSDTTHLLGNSAESWFQSAHEYAVLFHKWLHYLPPARVKAALSVRRKKKGKVVPEITELSCMSLRHVRGGVIAPQFFTSVVPGGELSTSSPGRFTPGERDSSTHCSRGRLGPRAGLNTIGKRKLCPCR